MKKIKFLHCSDLHIGNTTHGHINPETRLNTRLEDLMRNLDEMVHYAVEQKVDIVLISGDIYDKSNPTPVEQCLFAERIKTLSEAEMKVIIIPGNHDVTTAGSGASALDIFEALQVPNVWVCRKPDIMTILYSDTFGIQIACLPWTSGANLMTRDEYREMNQIERRMEIERRLIAIVNDLASKMNPEYPAILMGHFAVSGSVLSGTESQTLAMNEPQIPLSEITNQAFRYVALGHIHKHQDLNVGFRPPVVYAGGLERIDFSEEGHRKGYIYGEIELEVYEEKYPSQWVCWYQFNDVPARPFLTVKLLETGLPETLPGNEIDGAIVRIRYEIADPDKQPDEKALRAMYSRAFSVKIERIIKHQKPKPRHHVEQEAGPIDALEKYLKTRPELAGIAAEMKEVAEKLLQEKEIE